MILANHHSHTNYSDGVGTPEEYVRAALAAGFGIYGFSDHAPLPPGEESRHSMRDLPAYVSITDELRNKYSGRIELYRSLEIDYLPGEMHVNSPHLAGADLDYSIGAVHFIGRLRDGQRWSFQRQDPAFQRGVDEIFGGSVQRVLEQYFANLREMVTKHPTDVVAHLDRILKRNHDDRFWDRRAKWYRHAILETLDAIAAAGCIMEVNTRGLYQGDNPTTYPDDWTLSEARRRDIPVHLASDAHATWQINQAFDRAAEVLLQAGYESVRVFSAGKWTDIALEVPVIAPATAPH